MRHHHKRYLNSRSKRRSGGRSFSSDTKSWDDWALAPEETLRFPAGDWKTRSKRPSSQDARRICAAAIPAAPAARRRESTQLTAAIPTLAIFPQDRQTLEKTGPGEPEL